MNDLPISDHVSFRDNSVEYEKIYQNEHNQKTMLYSYENKTL